MEAPLASDRWVEFDLQRWAGLVKSEISLKVSGIHLFRPSKLDVQVASGGFSLQLTGIYCQFWRSFSGLSDNALPRSFETCPCHEWMPRKHSQAHLGKLLTQLLTCFWPKLSALGHPAKFRSWHRSGAIDSLDVAIFWPFLPWGIRVWPWLSLYQVTLAPGKAPEHTGVSVAIDILIMHEIRSWK